MRQYLINTVRAQTLRSILVQELDDEVLGFGTDRDAMTHRVWEAHRALTDQEVHPVLVAMEEGRNADDHLEDENSERPPVHGEVVTISNQHLRRQVLSRATE